MNGWMQANNCRSKWSVATLRQQADRLKALVRPLLADPAAPIPPRLTASLFDFYITAQGGRPACRLPKRPFAGKPAAWPR